MNPLLLVGCLAVFTGDTITTNIALSRGYREAVIPSQHRAVITATIAAQEGIGCIGYRILHPHHPKLANALIGVTMTSRGVAVTWNIAQLRKSR
jgi:hypothetical protein